MSATPRTRKGLRTRGNILKAASRVFARDGYVEARMLDIATEAGISTGGLYRYFDNKTDLFAALISELHEAFYSLSGNTEHSLDSDPLAALTEANRRYIEHYYEHRHVMRAFIEAASVEERFRLILRDMRERHVKRFSRTYRAIHGSGRIDGVPLEIAAEALACMVEQCCYAWFADEAEPEARATVEEAVAITSRAWYATMFATLD